MRTVDKLITAETVPEGAGVVVRRAFPSRRLSYIDPFLLLDHLDSDYAPGGAAGFPEHPHRGFETVTYVLAGKMKHKDSNGNQGLLGPGDVQWMTAGSGIIHSELPEEKFREAGGLMDMFQLWVNLPAAAKMTAPRYQEFKSSDIPVVTKVSDKQNSNQIISVKIIAGNYDGVSAPTTTHIPIAYFHINLSAGACFSQEVGVDDTVLIYPIKGRPSCGEQVIPSETLAVLKKDSDKVQINAAEEASFLFFSGKPLNEPVSRWGPFVMNTEAEIKQAIIDYQQGRLVQPASQSIEIR